MPWPWFGDEARRRRLHRCAPEGPLRDFYATPAPRRGAALSEIKFVALDLETTGLEPVRDEIVSVGFVELSCQRIDLSTSRHHLLAPTTALPEASVVVHQITDDHAASGRPLHEVLPEVLGVLSGKVLVAHHAVIERRFLDAACRRCYGCGLMLPAIDTALLFRRWLERHHRSSAAGALRLPALRARYGLPRYRLHNALSDALAAAELFLAYLAQAQIAPEQPLKRLFF